MANEVRARASLKDDLSGPLTRIGDVWNKQSKNFTTGALAARGAEKAFSLVGQAIGAVGDLIGEATQAFIDDEHSQQKLTTSLRANAVGWDGTTAAINDRIAAGQALGFSDDDQRDSLAALVAAYGDVTQSLDVMRTAEDLARFSGVDLATATDTLVKVHAGNYRALKALGINTKGITTETQALAAVQKVASGQAADFAGTLEGRLAVAADKTNEAMEHLGQSTAEFSADFETAKAGFIEDAVKGLDGLADSINFSNQSLERQIEMLKADRDAYGSGLNGIRDTKIATLELALAQQKVTSETTAGEAVRAKAFDGMAQATQGLLSDMNSTADAFDELTDAEKRNIAKGKGVAATLDRIAGIADTLPSKLDKLNEALFGGAQASGDLAQAQQDLADIIDKAPKKGTRAFVIWQGKVAAAEQAVFDLQFQMKQKEGPEALDGWLRKQRDALGKTNTKARNYLNTLIAINSLNLTTVFGHGTTKITTGQYAGKIIPFADGGHYSAGVPRMVGERGPEIDVPDHSGTIIPNKALGGGGSTTININVSTPALTPGGAESLARYLEPIITRAQQRRGLVARV